MTDATAHPRDRIIDALMRLAADRPWSDIEVTDIAREAGVTLADFRDHFPSKGAVLGGLSRRIDKQVLQGTGTDLDDEPARERLFDVLMRRLDALTPYKAALKRIAYSVRTDLGTLAALNQMALNSHRFMLAAAGIQTEDALGGLKLQGTVIAFGRVLDTWFTDDDPALAATMARLDKELNRGERILERADDFRRLTAPFRALAQSLLDRRPRTRQRSRGDDGEAESPAVAI